MAYLSTVLPFCLILLYFAYQVFLRVGDAYFVRNAFSNDLHMFKVIRTTSSHIAAAPLRYPPTIYAFRLSFQLFVKAIRLNLSNHSCGSSSSVPSNSSGLRINFSLNPGG